jgi:hypothetical protein
MPDGKSLLMAALNKKGETELLMQNIGGGKPKLIGTKGLY